MFVTLPHMSIDTGDDCIAVNSGMNEDGMRVNRPCENIVIRGCTMNGGHGGIVIGSAMSGGVKNIKASDCRISNTMQGIRLKSMRGRGGYVEGVSCKNIELHNISDQLIQINMFYGFSTVIPKSQVPPVFQDISIENVQGDGSGIGIELKGLPEQPLMRLSLKQIHLKAGQSLVAADVEGISLEDVRIEAL